MRARVLSLSAAYALALALVLAGCGGGQASSGTPSASTPPRQRVDPTASRTGAGVAALLDDAPWEALFHTCAVRAPGRVLCWGANEQGELADGSREDRFAPVAPRGVPDDVAQVSAGLGMSCALRRSGEVVCWGPESTATPTAIAGVTDAVQVSAGAGYACAVTRDGHVRCWGRTCGECPGGAPPAGGERAMGSCGTRHHCRVPAHVEPTDIAGIDDAVQVSTGGSLEGNEHDGSWNIESPCAVRADGRVACWDAHAPAAAAATRELRHVAGIPPAHRVSTRGRYGVIAARDGTVHEWRTDSSDAPRAVPGLTDVVAVSAGWRFGCALHRRGEVSCWEPMRGAPEQVEGIGPARAVLVGAHHRCVELRTGEVRCWGSSDRGWLGSGLLTVQPRPVRITLPDTAVSIGAGVGYTCARLRDRTVACWGSNHTGTLGRGAADSALPFSIEAERVPGVAEASTLAVGDYHACVLRAGDMLTCWGGNHTGAFGAPPYEYRMSPTDALAMRGVHTLAAGSHRTCVADANGAVRCAGNDQGTFRPLPEATSRGAPSALTVTSLTACTLGTHGALRCSDSFAPLVTPAATSVSARGERVCAITTDARAMCWRLVARGTSFVPEAEQAATVPDAIEIAAGDHHECVRTRGGTVLCRGANAQGEVGDGTTDPRAGFVAVVGLADVAAFAVGSRHACALDVRGAVWCWGSNREGEIGIAPTAVEPTPVAFP